MCTCHYLAFAICTSPVIHLVRPLKLYITFVFNFSWVLQPSQKKLKTIELERFTFALDGKREFVPRDRPSLSFTFYNFYSKISSFAPILSIRIELDSFCLLIFCFEKYSTWIWRLQFAVDVICNLSKAYAKGWAANKVHFGKCGSGEWWVSHLSHYPDCRRGQ